jgi:hypothetical protein
MTEQNIPMPKAYLTWPICAIYFGVVLFVTIYLDRGSIAGVFSKAIPSKCIRKITYVLWISNGNTFPEKSLLPSQFFEQSKGVLCILHIVGIFVRRTMSFGAECFIFMVSLSAWLYTKRLSSKIRNTTSSNFNTMHLVDVVSFYKSTKDLLASINETVQPLFLTYILEGFFFYSVSLKLVLSLSLDSIFVTFFFITYFLIFTFAAEAHENVNEMKTWLSQPTVREHLSVAELSHLRFDILANPVGLSGNRIFIVNYNLAICVSFVGTLVIFEIGKPLITDRLLLNIT